MEPFFAKTLPIEYKVDKELLKLLGIANEKYGQYKSLLKMFKFDQQCFLDSLVLGESIRSSIIEGTQISQDDMYYIEYKSLNEDNADYEEVRNLKKMLIYATKQLEFNNFDINLINEMHKILLSGVRGRDKNPGCIRTTQNYIGIKGLGQEGATFIPPVYEDVKMLLDNLMEYMNEMYDDEALIKVAIAHMQLETIHPYNDGNGRIGRALMSLHLAKLKNDEPILFLSEVIELYKANYYNSLNECRTGNIGGFIRFFLQCVNDQCTRNIIRIEQISKVYDEDKEMIKNHIKSPNILDIHDYLMKKIVITSEELKDNLNIHQNTISTLLKKLVQLGIIVKEKKEGTNRNTYRYIRVYNVFVSQV